jgi:hypothetical protein
MSGFVFDAKAVRAAIAARRMGRGKPAVPAVSAVNPGASSREPREPQKPQTRGLTHDRPIRVQQPQEPQQPQPRATPKDYADEIEERAALTADRVQPCYLDVWARLNCQKPAVSEAEWRLALDDGGRFLDDRGTLAAELQWTAGDLFDVPRDGTLRGLVWLLKGKRVEALGADHARLAGGGKFERRAERSPHVSTGLRQAERI